MTRSQNRPVSVERGPAQQDIPTATEVDVGRPPSLGGETYATTRPMIQIPTTRKAHIQGLSQ